MPDRASTINLGAGPSPLPTDVLEQAASGLLNYQNLGIGIAELSHRSATFQTLIRSCSADLRALLYIPDNFEVLYMQGGGWTQFAAVPLNLVGAERLKKQYGRDEKIRAEYVVTGSWSAKAVGEARRLGVDVDVVLDSRKSQGGDGKSFGIIPDATEWSWNNTEKVDPMPSQASEETAPAPGTRASDSANPRRPPAYLYYCDNETVNGVEFPSPGFPIASLPASHAHVPIVADMSSNILSRPIPPSLWDRLGVVYAGAQKNMGPAGVTIVIVRKDLIVNLDEAVQFGATPVPTMLWYKTMADQESLFNTPPMFAIYVCALVYQRLLAAGGVVGMEKINKQKAELVYRALDDSGGFYIPKVERKCRSRMNVVFTLKGGQQMEEKLVKEAGEAGFKQIKGHRSVGGIRTSLYNAVTLDQTYELCAFLKSFSTANA